MTQKITQKQLVDSIKELNLKITVKDMMTIARELIKKYIITNTQAEDLLTSKRHMIRMNTYWHHIDDPDDIVLVNAVISGTERDPSRGMTVVIPQQVLIYGNDTPSGRYIDAHEFIQTYLPKDTE